MTYENKLQVSIYMNINLMSEISSLVNIKIYREGSLQQKQTLPSRQELWSVTPKLLYVTSIGTFNTLQLQGTTAIYKNIALKNILRHLVMPKM